MKRSMMQAYVINSTEAVALYRRAFDAALISSYLNEDGTYYHSELDIQGNILAVSERRAPYAIAGPAATGNTMQFCLEFDEGCEDKLRKAYDALSENATIIKPLAPCDYSPLMADLIDKFGIRWCLFV